MTVGGPTSVTTEGTARDPICYVEVRVRGVWR